MQPSTLIALGKYHALAGLASKDTGHHFINSCVGNTTHGHFIFFSDLILEFRVAAEAHRGKTTVYFGCVDVLRREKFDKVSLGRDLTSVLFLEGFGLS